MLSPERLNLFLSIGAALGSAATAISVYLRKPGEDAGEKVRELKEEVDTELQLHAQRITLVESDIRHLPTAKDLEGLRAAVLVNREHTDGIARSLEAMQKQLGRIEDFLHAMKLEEAKRYPK